MTNPNNAADLQRLADLICERNANEVAITGIVGRPAQLGHIGEYIASRIFDIELKQDATHRGSDGHFRSGQLAGKSVDVKFYAKREGVLDIKRKHLPDYYLVLAGPSLRPHLQRDQPVPGVSRRCSCLMPHRWSRGFWRVA